MTRALALDDVIRIVCDAAGVEPHQLRTAHRGSYTVVRAVCTYLARTKIIGPPSYSDITARLRPPGTSHSTAITSLQIAERAISPSAEPDVTTWSVRYLIERAERVIAREATRGLWVVSGSPRNGRKPKPDPRAVENRNASEAIQER